MLIGKVPVKAIFDNYRRSRKIMGVAFLVYCLQFFFQWKLNARDNFPTIASALNITFFYLAAILLGFSFISLLKERYITKLRIIYSFAGWILFSLVVWLSIFLLPGNTAKYVLIFSALWLFVLIAYLSWDFFEAYRDAVKKIRNYHSDEVDGFIRWINKSVFFAVIMGLLCSVMAFAPKWMLTLYLIVSIPFFYYIFICFIDYLVNFEIVDSAFIEDADTSEEHVSLNFAGSRVLDKKLKQWVTAKGYLHPKVNLGELSKLLSSNRSYLSNYINATYSCTYYEWVAKLRINEAKEIFTNEPDLTIAQISDRVGFSSSSHFIATFTKLEKISPSRYRRLHEAPAKESIQV